MRWIVEMMIHFLSDAVWVEKQSDAGSPSEIKLLNKFTLDGQKFTTSLTVHHFCVSPD